MTREHDYILGTEREELERLGFQHKAWLEQALHVWDVAGIRAGHSVLDLGSGPGFTSFDLAHVVGSTGRVIARDQSAAFLEYLTVEASRRGLAQVEPSPGAVEDLDLPDECLDAAYARWLFCWLPDPAAAVRRVARSLRPGAALVVQDYLDWGTMAVAPRNAHHARIVEACLASWVDGGIDIDVCRKVPELAAASDLRVEHFRPVARVGAVGSLEWTWLSGFYATYLPKLVERGLLGADELEAFRTEWARLEAEGRSFVVAPLLANVVLRKP